MTVQMMTKRRRKVVKNTEKTLIYVLLYDLDLEFHYPHFIELRICIFDWIICLAIVELCVLLLLFNVLHASVSMHCFRMP